MKIFLLEDDFILNEIIEEHLAKKNYDVKTAFDGNEAEQLLYSEKFDLLLLDVNVPGIDGFEILKTLRESGVKTPSIFITSLDMVNDIEKGFKSGCDDYIKKPFELKELDLRIENLKRLFNLNENDIISINSKIDFDIKNLLIIKNNEKVQISKKESEVLNYFLRKKNQVISIEELSLNIWSYEDSPNDSTIRTYIKNLRKFLGEDLITNIRGVGYKFNS